MTRLFGLIALLSGSALLLWVGFAAALELPVSLYGSPLKPMLLGVVLLSGGFIGISHGDDEAELSA